MILNIRNEISAVRASLHPTFLIISHVIVEMSEMYTFYFPNYILLKIVYNVYVVHCFITILFSHHTCILNKLFVIMNSHYIALSYSFSNTNYMVLNYFVVAVRKRQHTPWFDFCQFDDAILSQVSRFSWNLLRYFCFSDKKSSAVDPVYMRRVGEGKERDPVV